MGKSTFGENLRRLRENRQLGQKEIADCIHKSIQAYSQYELGKREPDIETMITLADYFNVTLDRLLGRVPLRHIPDPAKSSEQAQEEAKKPAPSDHVVLLRSDEFSNEAMEKIRVYIEDIKTVEKSKKLFHR